jgi:hypothetical protein
MDNCIKEGWLKSRKKIILRFPFDEAGVVKPLKIRFFSPVPTGENLISASPNLLYNQSRKATTAR